MTTTEKMEAVAHKIYKLSPIGHSLNAMADFWRSEECFPDARRWLLLFSWLRENDVLARNQFESVACGLPAETSLHLRDCLQNWCAPDGGDAAAHSRPIQRCAAIYREMGLHYHESRPEDEYHIREFITRNRATISGIACEGEPAEPQRQMRDGFGNAAARHSSRRS
jgi:hypothetical protein